jgi:hypothetical protein
MSAEKIPAAALDDSERSLQRAQEFVWGLHLAEQAEIDRRVGRVIRLDEEIAREQRSDAELRR